VWAERGGSELIKLVNLRTVIVTSYNAEGHHQLTCCWCVASTDTIEETRRLGLSAVSTVACQHAAPRRPRIRHRI
jgi:hypothetical protein